MIMAEDISVEAVQNRVYAAFSMIATHISNLIYQLVVQKKEAVVINKKCGAPLPKIMLQGEKVTIGDKMKYYGIILKSKGTIFGAHLRATRDKDHRIMPSLERLMLNIRSPRERKRRHSCVVHSVLLYRTPTLAPRYLGDKRT